MICSNCATENKPGRRFCVECGASLATGCPSCGAPFEPGEKFCGTCGTALTTDAVPAATGLAARIAAPTAPRRPNAASCRSSSPTWSASRRSQRSVTRRTSGPRSTATSPSPGRHRPLRRDRREVHRRCRDGRLGHPDRPRGRRRAGGPRGAGPGRRGPRPGRRDPGTGRRPDRRGRRHDRGHESGPGRGRSGQHRQPPPVGRRSRARSSSARRPSARRARRSRSRRPAIRRSRARRARCRRGGRCGSSPRSAAATARTRSRPRSWAATTSCASSRTSSTPRPARAAPASSRSSAPPASARRRLAWEFLKYVDGLVETGLVARRPQPRVRRGRHVLGPGRDGPRRAGLLETDDEATTRAKIAASVAEHVPDPDERRWIESALLTLLGVRGRRGLGSAVRGVADVLRTARRHGAGRTGLRGLPLRRRGPARLRRPPARVEPRRSRSTS